MKIAIVTGGSNGIGKATALELGRRGIGVILTYNSYKDRAEAVVNEIESMGARAVALKLDLSQRSTFDGFMNDVKANLRKVGNRTTFDYLVNNGGIGGPMMFEEMTEEYFDNILNTNFKGPFFLTQELVRFMEDAGAIVNTSSSSSAAHSPAIPLTDH